MTHKLKSRPIKRIKRKVHHYAVPHIGNNFRAKLLHISSLFVIILAFLITGISSVYLHHTKPEVLGISYSISSDELVSITNRYRAEKGLGPLTINSNLSQAAQQKASDMLQKNYWAHFAPDGSTSPWIFIKGSGYSYMYAGENLAKGFTNSEDVVRAWMDSPTHRDNMLSSNYKDIGFAIVTGTLQGEETVLVVEMFGSTSESIAAAGSEISDATVQTEESVPTSVQISLTQVPNPVVSRTQPVITTAPIVQANAQTLVMAEQQKAEPSVLEKVRLYTSPFINMSTWSFNIVSAVFGILLVVLVIDLIIIERKKIPRFVGHNLDHILIIGIFLLIIFFTKGGNIL